MSCLLRSDRSCLIVGQHHLTESEALFKKYKESGDPDTGNKLMTSLKEGRCKRWSEEMAALDFTHSSRRALSLLRKLGGATLSKRQQPKVTENEVAHQLLLNGSVKKDRKQAKRIQKQQREPLLTAQKHQLCRKLSPPMKSLMLSRQQRQVRLLDQVGSSQTC